MTEIKKHSKYTDKRVSKYDHVTVVHGEARLNKEDYRAIIRKIDRLTDAYLELKPEATATGRAICSPEDEYNEETGLFIASRRAEIKSTMSLLKQITKLRKEAEEYLNLLLDIEDGLDYTVGSKVLELCAKLKEDE